MSETQERLEVAAKAVTEACKALVKLVLTISAKQVEKEDVDYKNMAGLEFKKREMEQHRDFTFGERPGRGETSAGGNASCRVSHGRDRLMSLDYTTMDLNARRHVGLWLFVRSF
jgi:I/LWEQ domain